MFYIEDYCPVCAQLNSECECEFNFDNTEYIIDTDTDICPICLKVYYDCDCEH